MKVLGAFVFVLLHARQGAACNGQCIVDGPSDRSQQAKWLADLVADRENTIKTIKYSGGVFDEVKWTQSAWIQPQMHPYDRYFYDPISHSYTVDKYLEDLKTRYGGVNAILMWPTYTNIG